MAEISLNKITVKPQKQPLGLIFFKDLLVWPNIRERKEGSKGYFFGRDYTLGINLIVKFVKLINNVKSSR